MTESLAALQSIGHTVTVEELAQRLNLKPQVVNGETEYHGGNPWEAGAENHGFWINSDGTAYDRKAARRYESREVEALAGLARYEYEPERKYSQRGGAHNGNIAPKLPATPQASPAQKAAPKTPPKAKVRFDWARATIHEYQDETGALLFQVARIGTGDEKDIKQRRPDGDGGWVYGLGKGFYEPATCDGVRAWYQVKSGETPSPKAREFPETRRVLYRLPDVLNAATVFLCEGEKDAAATNAALEAAQLFGEYVATTAPHGAGKFRAEYADALRATCDVFVLPDNDAQGRAGAENDLRVLAASQREYPARLVELPDLPEKGGAADFLGAGGTVAQIIAHCEAAPEWKPTPEEAPETASTRDEKPAFEFAFTTDSDLDERLGEIEWLWNNYIPRGFVTGIVADQDQGKSTVAQNFCDTILRGTRWPDGAPHAPQPGTKLLWIDTEGSIALFHQRVKAWGMPRGRFILPPDPLQELTVDDCEHWAWIEAAIEKFQPPLVVIDALSGAHKSGKENGNDEMKLVMKKLAGLAQRFNIAVLVVHHLNKPAPGVASYPISVHRLRGASAISQYCRSILALGTPDINQPENRRLDVIKLNLTVKPKSVGYQLTDSGPVWGEAPEMPKERCAIDNALDFLEIAMQSGPRLASDIEEEAKAEKIGSNALHDAKKALKIKALREGGKEGRWFWYPEKSEVTV